MGSSIRLDLLEKLVCETRTDDGTRIYKTPVGAFPSVTTILKETSDRSWLKNWQKRVGKKKAQQIGKEASERGNALHAMVETYLLTGKPGCGPWWDSVAHVLQDIDNVRLVEGPVWHEGLKFAGTVDLIADYRGQPVVLDWKTSSRVKERGQITDYIIQTSAYAGSANILYKAQGVKIGQSVVVIALEGQDAHVHQFGKDELIIYWKQFTGRVQDYYASRA